jgi:hypothetical protein
MIFTAETQRRREKNKNDISARAELAPTRGWRAERAEVIFANRGAFLPPRQ